MSLQEGLMGACTIIQKPYYLPHIHTMVTSTIKFLSSNLHVYKKHPNIAPTWRHISFKGPFKGKLRVGGMDETCQEKLRRAFTLLQNLTAGPRLESSSHMGACQKSGPFLGPLNTRCRIMLRTKKGTIILTTIHISHSSLALKGIRRLPLHASFWADIRQVLS